MHICIIELKHYWFWLWLGASLTPIAWTNATFVQLLRDSSICRFWSHLVHEMGLCCQAMLTHHQYSPVGFTWWIFYGKWSRDISLKYAKKLQAENWSHISKEPLNKPTIRLGSCIIFLHHQPHLSGLSHFPAPPQLTHWRLRDVAEI